MMCTTVYKISIKYMKKMLSQYTSAFAPATIQAAKAVFYTSSTIYTMASASTYLSCFCFGENTLMPADTVGATTCARHWFLLLLICCPPCRTCVLPMQPYYQHQQYYIIIVNIHRGIILFCFLHCWQKFSSACTFCATASANSFFDLLPPMLPTHLVGTMCPHYATNHMFSFPNSVQSMQLGPIR